MQWPIADCADHRSGPTLHSLHTDRFLSLIVKVSAVGYLAAIAISFRLWFNVDRVFPTYPVEKFLAPNSAIFTGDVLSIHVLPMALVGALVGLVARPNSLYLLTVAIASTSALVIADVHRLQPWVYQYTLTFFLAALNLGRRNFSFKTTILLILFGTYFWSGLHKFNAGFLSNVVPYLAKPLLWPSSTPPHWLEEVGLTIPFVEAFFAVGLLLTSLRPFAALGIIYMHLLILLAIGPLGYGANPVIWPWNVVMIALLFITAIDTSKTRTGKTPRCSLLSVCAVALFVLLPALGLVSWWPSYMSMKLYSGNQIQIWIVMEGEMGEDIPHDLQALLYHDGTDRSIMAVSSWAHASMNVPAFPEKAALIHAARHFNTVYLRNRGAIWITPRLDPIINEGYFRFFDTTIFTNVPSSFRPFFERGEPL